jgi:hypothetical protein
MVILDSELPIYQRVKFQLWKKRDKNELQRCADKKSGIGFSYRVAYL